MIFSTQGILNRLYFIPLSLLLLFSGPLSGAATNVNAEQRPGTRLVDITYDLAQTSYVVIEVRTAPSEPYTAVTSVTGDVGPAIPAGNSKSVVWDAETDLPSTLLPSVSVRVVAVPEANNQPYSVSGRAIEIVGGIEYAITNGSGVTVTAVQYSDNTCISANFNILGQWEINGIVGPARIIARYDSLNPRDTIEKMMEPQITEVDGPTEGLVLKRIFGDDNDVEQCPDLSGAGEVEVQFADLDAAVRHALQIGVDDPVTVNDAASITFLNQSFTREAGITDLSGAQFLTGLSSLDLSGNNNLSDITPLLDLPLDGLSLSQTSVVDLAELNAITTLKTLALQGFSGNNVSALSDLTNLESLDLSSSQVTDLTGLSDLPSLQSLRLSGRTTSSPRIVASRAPVSDLGPLASAPSLRVLFLNQTSVANIDTLPSIPSLESLWLMHSFVSDLNPLLNLPNLENVNLSYMPNVDWENYIGSWSIVDTLEAKGVNVVVAFDTWPVNSLRYNLTGEVEPLAGLNAVNLNIVSGLGTEAVSILPGEPWSFPVRGPATVTPSYPGFSFEPESVTAPNRAIPSIVFTPTQLGGIRGQVLDPSGQPVSNLEIEITRTDTDSQETQVVTTGPDGRYFGEYPLEADLTLLPRGAEFAVEPADGRPQPVETSGGFVVNFTAYPRPSETLAVTRSASTSLINTATGATSASAILDGFGPVWSPDGQRLAVTRSGGTESGDQLIIADADGSNASVRVSYSDLNADASPGTFSLQAPYDWSANNEILFSAQYVVGSELVSGPFPYRVDANSGQPVSLLPGFTSGGDLIYTPGFSGSGTWAPDGERYVIASSLNSTSAPIRFRAGTRSQSSMADLGLSGSFPVWSPDGSELLYTNGPDLFVVSIDSENNVGTPVRLGKGTRPTWSPDGRWIAFEIDEQIHIRPRHAPVDTSALLAPGLWPAWQP